MDDSRNALLKAHVFKAPEATSQVITDTAADAGVFGSTGAIEPPYSPAMLAMLFEHSNALRQNVDAYVTNIDGFGLHLEPVIDLDKPDADQRIAQVIYQERLRARDVGAATSQPLTPTPDEIDARKRQLVEDMRAERAQVEAFLESCCDGISFVTMRRRIRQDLEVTGNAYIEVLRDGLGTICEFVYIPSYTVRLMPLHREPVEVRVHRRVSPITIESRAKRKRFRRFVQSVDGQTVYFKEFGDPRVVSARSGKTYQSVFAMRADEGDVAVATEILHFKIHSPRSPYGVPRWIGNLLSVMGSRQAEEVNYLYFDNKSVPPLALLVSGGHITDDTVKRIESFIETELKGRQNFHKILVLEAESQAGSLDATSRMRITLQPLTNAQQRDALFQEYDANNQDKVGMSFRLPRMLRGDVRDFNRSTAEASLNFAERQVFGPERAEFDFTMNQLVLLDMGVRFWRFRSNGPEVKDPETLAGIIAKLSDAGVLTPEEGRQLAEDVFHRELARIDAPWVRQPIALTLQGIAGGDDESIAPWVGEDGELSSDYAEFDDLDADGARDKSTAPRVDAAVTPTALSSVLTVNEVRQTHGFGPRMLDDGVTPDPLGTLTVADFMAEMQRRREQQAGQGLAGRIKRDPRLAREVKRLVAIRQALLDAEAAEAAASFMRAKRAAAEAGTETEVVKVPPEVWDQWMGKANGNAG